MVKDFAPESNVQVINALLFLQADGRYSVAWRSLWRPTSLQNSILSMSASSRQFIFPSKVLVTNGAIGLWKHDGNFVLTDPVVLSTDVEFGTTDGDYGFVVEESGRPSSQAPLESY